MNTLFTVGGGEDLGMRLFLCALEILLSESIGRVRVSVLAGELDFQYHIDPWEPSRCTFRPS